MCMAHTWWVIKWIVKFIYYGWFIRDESYGESLVVRLLGFLLLKFLLINIKGLKGLVCCKDKKVRDYIIYLKISYLWIVTLF